MTKFIRNDLHAYVPTAAQYDDFEGAGVDTVTINWDAANWNFMAECLVSGKRLVRHGTHASSAVNSLHVALLEQHSKTTLKIERHGGVSRFWQPADYIVSGMEQAGVKKLYATKLFSGAGYRVECYYRGVGYEAVDKQLDQAAYKLHNQIQIAKYEKPSAAASATQLSEALLAKVDRAHAEEMTTMLVRVPVKASVRAVLKSEGVTDIRITEGNAHAKLDGEQLRGGFTTSPTNQLEYLARAIKRAREENARRPVDLELTDAERRRVMGVLGRDVNFS